MVTVAFSNSYFRDVDIASYKPFTIDPAAEVINCTEPDQVASEVRKLQTTWLSWDMEWRYDPATDARGKVALIQLGDPKRILLIRTVGMLELPQELVDILENPNIPKIGVNIRGDGKKVHDDFGIQPQGLLELSRVAHKLDKEFWKDRSFFRPIRLQHLVARYLKRYLPKEMRISDWELELSEEQRFYAACDVDAYNQIFKRFILLAADNPETIDFLSDPECRVKYDDPDPFHAAPLKATQSAPAVLAGSTSSLPISPPRPHTIRVVVMPPQRSTTLATLAPAPVPATPSTGERELDASHPPLPSGQAAPQDELAEGALSSNDAEEIDFDDDDDFELSEEMERQLDELEEQHARAKRAASADSDATSRTPESPPKKPKVA